MSRRIQNEDVKTLADITAGGGSASQLINDTKVYVTGVGKQLSQSITDKDLLPVMVGDSGSGGAKGLVPAPAAGDATKYLKGNGTWSTVAGGGGALTVQTNVYASPGVTVWNKPANCLWVDVIVIGGGGGGGGAKSIFSGTAAGIGGGGGGGGVAIKKFLASALSASETVTVGAGGTAGNGTSLANGGAGGQSVFGTSVLLDATGGSGGITANGTTIPVYGSGVSGGAGSSGQPNVSGRYGEIGFLNSAGYGLGGYGGDSGLGYGQGGKQVAFSSLANGVNGELGGGGSGAVSSWALGGGSVNGGAGGNGMVIVYSYIG